MGDSVRFCFETGAEVGGRSRVEVVGVVDGASPMQSVLSGMVGGTPAAHRIGVQLLGEGAVEVCRDTCCEKQLETEALISVRLPSL